MSTPDTAVQASTPPVPQVLPFGPEFFLTHLAAFVRQQCPDPGEGLPIVHLHLLGGEVLDLCHIIGLTPCLIGLAVYDDGVGESSRTMRTELVPYALFMRVTIRSGKPNGPRIGFQQEMPPVFGATPEEALQLAATPRVVLVPPGAPVVGGAIGCRDERASGRKSERRRPALRQGPRSGTR